MVLCYVINYRFTFYFQYNFKTIFRYLKWNLFMLPCIKYSKKTFFPMCLLFHSEPCKWYENEKYFRLISDAIMGAVGLPCYYHARRESV